MALLLTGRPGVGKTTVLRAAAQKLGDRDLVGFYTEEIRAGRERRGFCLVTFGGDEASLPTSTCRPHLSASTVSTWPPSIDSLPR